MRCFICNKDCPDGEIRVERKGKMVTFSPCAECSNAVVRSLLFKDIENEEAPTLPLWDIE